MLAKRFPRLAQDDRLAIYQDTWVRVLAKRQRGERIESLRAYLLATAGAEALHLVSRARIPSPIGPDDPRLAGLSDDAPPLDEQVVTRDQARIARNLLDTLDERQRNVLKLRWDLQLSGAEVRAALGLSERQYRRLAEEGAVAIAERVEELQSGQWSRRTRSLLVACLVEVTQDGQRRVGIASRRQREEAKRLLESDPHVAALYAEVRRSIRGAAALLPLPALAADSDSALAGRILEQAIELRDQITDAVGTAKQHATSLYLRAADPQLLAGGPRPGTAAVAIAGVIAVGGGAYGAHQAASTPNITPAAAVTTPPLAAPPAALLPTSAPKLTASTPKPGPAAQPSSAQPDVPAQAPTPPPSVPAAAPPPSPTQSPQPSEFGFED